MSLYYSEQDNMYYKVDPDEYSNSPREWDHDSTLITFERDYESPDKNQFNDWDEMLKHFGIKESSGKIHEDMDTLRENALKKGIVAMPVWKYDHSGLAYKCAERYPFHDGRGNGFGWDGGIVGIIYEKRNRRPIDEVINGFKAELEDYTRYANGWVYEVATYDKSGELIDSIGGIYVGYGDEKTIQDAVDNGHIEMNGNKDNLVEVGHEIEYYWDEEQECQGFYHPSIEDRIAMHQEDLAEHSLADQIQEAKSEVNEPVSEGKTKDLEI